MKTKHLLLVLATLLLVSGITVGAYYFQKQIEKEDSALVTAEDTAKRFRPSLVYQNGIYPLKRNISSLLLIGTDNYIDDDKQMEEGIPYNYNHADFVAILVFDHANKTVTPVHMCRDSMCAVNTVLGLKRLQLNMAHTMGTGKEDSCIAVRDTLENLLYGAPIDNFFSFSMETVPLLNDLVGGVTVTLEDDIPQLGEEYVAGATVTLNGKNALKFVRFRDLYVGDDNLRRMAHQRQYLSAFTEAARKTAARDQDLAVKAFKLIDKYVCTDMTVDGISRLVDNLCNYEVLPVVSPPGEYVKGKVYMEYNLDETALWECVRSVFCA